MKFLKCIFVLCILLGCQKRNNEKRVSFLAVGDLLLHQRLLEYADEIRGVVHDGQYDFLSYFQNVEPYIQQADLSFVNQETILGGENHGISGYPLFNSPDIIAETLETLGFDIVNGATNHAMDQGYDGLKHSLEVFSKYPNISYIGLHQSKNDAIAVVEKNDIRFALLSYNQYDNQNSLPNDYCVSHFDKNKIKKEVNQAKEISDFIIVSCHWGEEYDMKPNTFQKEYAKYLAYLGVDVIIGTHSHTLQDIEWIQGEKKTLVIYSLGNFISGMMEKETQLGGMVSLDFVKKENSCTVEKVKLVPLVNHYQADSKNVYDTRSHFQVYPLKEYTIDLAKKHGLNGYQGIHIDVESMKNILKQRKFDNVQIDM